ncbi:MAG: hypothetical protein WC531_01680 [Candidatus Paceibacterota bacterium]|jgi:hypothetical protein
MKESPVTLNEGRAFEVFTALTRAIAGKEGVFAEVVYPQDRYPMPDEPVARANYLIFASLLMRGPVNSDDPFRWFHSLFERHPDLFDPRQVARGWTVEKILGAFREATQQLLGGNGTGQKGTGVMGYQDEEHARAWIANANYLVNRWDGNILRVFDGVFEFEQAFARVNRQGSKGEGLIGIRRKIFSLFVIFLQQYQILPDFPTPIPVDFHALRVLQGTGVVTLKKMRPCEVTKPEFLAWHEIEMTRIGSNITDAIARWSQWFMVLNGFETRQINPALWVLSRERCANQFQNRTRGRKETRQRVGEPIALPQALKEHPSLWPANYDDPCHHCPVEKFCRFIAPSSPYYGYGQLARIERVDCPIPRTDCLF